MHRFDEYSFQSGDLFLHHTVAFDAERDFNDADSIGLKSGTFRSQRLHASTDVDPIAAKQLSFQLLNGSIEVAFKLAHFTSAMSSRAVM